MQEKKLLRDALEWLVNLHHGMSKGGPEFSPPQDDEWKAALTAAKGILASTTDETEMETLRAWVFATRKELLEETPRTDPYDRGYLNALATVRDYITTQFLEEAGE